MNILGVGGLIHNASAVIVSDGNLIAAVEEERFSRKKHDGFYGFSSTTSGLPWRSINYCLKEGGLNWSQIDAVGYFFNPWSEYKYSLKLNTRNILKSPSKAAYRFLSDTNILKEHLKAKALVLKQNPKIKFYFIKHHLTHASSSFFVSSFDKSLVLINDGKGESDTNSILIGENNNIKFLDSVAFPHSIGMLYMEVTQFLGFRGGEDEYKVMGLASYGEPSYINNFRDILRISKDGLSFKLNLDYFKNPLIGPGLLSEKFYRIFGPGRDKRDEIKRNHIEIATSLQLRVEEVILEILSNYKEKTKIKNLCIAGGVGLNSVLNGRILSAKMFDDIYIPPATGDAGCALGAAYYIHNVINKQPRTFELKHAFWGPAYDDNEIKYYLDQAKLNYTELQNIAVETAKLIAEGNIVGWFQGKMEFGPRALGARSILADPTREDMKDIVNKWVKHREDFRPFAPSVLKEKAMDYFENIIESPYMLFIDKVKQEKQKFVPAITHTDGTARPQTVDRETNKLYYEMIYEFEKIKGVPMVLNTSFNVMGEPIVESPEQAIRCFYGTGLDCLVIGKYLLRK